MIRYEKPQIESRKTLVAELTGCASGCIGHDDSFSWGHHSKGGWSWWSWWWWK